MIVPRGIFAALLGVVVLMAGCTDTKDPIASTTTTTSGSTTTTTTAPTPTMPTEADQPNPKGAAAFFRYYFAVYSYAYATLDDRELRAISDKNCVFCNSALAHIKGVKQAANRIEDGQVTVSTAISGPGDASKALTVNAVVDQAEVRTVDATGKIISKVPATKGNRVDAVVQWRSDRWAMLEIQVLKKTS